MARRPDSRSAEAAAYRRLYKSKAWANLRKAILTRDHFTCQWPECGVLLIGNRHQPNAPVVHHKIDHKGDERLFFEPRNLISVCKACHDSQAKSETISGYFRGATKDGRPIDPSHPWNRQ